MDAKVKIPDFQWAPNLSVGVEEMDNQHKALIELINIVISGLNQGENISKSLKQLAVEMKEHFDEEEEFLASVAYPDLENHKQIHADLISKLNLFVEAQSLGQLEQERLGTFLKMWLKSHIMGVDRKYAAFLEQKSA